MGAVTSVLEGAVMPLRYIEVKAEVEAVLGEAVPASTVKQALSAHSRSEGARFERVSRGRYRMSCSGPFRPSRLSEDDDPPGGPGWRPSDKEIL